MPAKKDSNPELESYGWDDLLPQKYFSKWSEWVESLQDIGELSVPRCYKGQDFGEVDFYELHTFVDASKDSIGLVIYLTSDRVQDLHRGRAGSGKYRRGRAGSEKYFKFPEFA